MSVINRLDNVKKLISDSKSCFKQFSYELKAENSYIKTSPTQKHYLTEDGNSLASVNELMSARTSLSSTILPWRNLPPTAPMCAISA